jgi:CRP-like cAMP-binding protein
MAAKEPGRSAQTQENERQYPAGSVIFKEQDQGSEVYLIRSGKIQICRTVGNNPRVLATLTAGDFFGEMALISDRPRSAQANAIEDSTVIVLSAESFFRMLRTDFDMSMRIMEQLTSRLAETDRRLEVLLFADATTRLVKMLESEEMDTVPLSLSQVSYELGVPLERIKKITEKLQAKGVIRVSEVALDIIDRTKLDKLKNFLFLKEEFGQAE